MSVSFELRLTNCIIIYTAVALERISTGSKYTYKAWKSRLHRAVSQKTVILLFTVARTLNLNIIMFSKRCDSV